MCTASSWADELQALTVVCAVVKSDPHPAAAVHVDTGVCIMCSMHYY